MEGLQVKKKQRRTRRKGQADALRQQAAHPNQVWSSDFVHDQTEHGSTFRILSLIDEHTRKCHVLAPAWSIKATDAIEHLKTAIAVQGSPEHLRSDNGPEFIAYAMQDWLSENNVNTAYINPGSPWEQGYVESFHDKLRDELLNRESSNSLEEARVLIEEWRKEYNSWRPHSSLDYLTPTEYRTLCEEHSVQPLADPVLKPKHKQMAETLG